MPGTKPGLTQGLLRATPFFAATLRIHGGARPRQLGHTLAGRPGQSTQWGRTQSDRVKIRWTATNTGRLWGGGLKPYPILPQC